jgi:hypothetical protein
MTIVRYMYIHSKGTTRGIPKFRKVSLSCYLIIVKLTTRLFEGQLSSFIVHVVV